MKKLEDVLLNINKMTNRKSIDFLRYAVNLFSNCNESFNQEHTAEELLKIADCMQRSEYDILPDRWTHAQLYQAIDFGEVPNWEETPQGLQAVYKAIYKY